MPTPYMRWVGKRFRMRERMKRKSSWSPTVLNLGSQTRGRQGLGQLYMNALIWEALRAAIQDSTRQREVMKATVSGKRGLLTSVGSGGCRCLSC